MNELIQDAVERWFENQTYDLEVELVDTELLFKPMEALEFLCDFRDTYDSVGTRLKDEHRLNLQRELVFAYAKYQNPHLPPPLRQTVDQFLHEHAKHARIFAHEMWSP